MSTATIQHGEQAQEQAGTAAFGFWVYLMTDCVLFATLFAAYGVLRGATFGGPGAEIFKLPNVLAETFILLASSFTCGLAILAAHRQNRTQTVGWLSATMLLGIGFLAMELTEFAQLIAQHVGPQRSAFLSSYFALVGAHGLHIAVGLLWMCVMMVQILRRGLPSATLSRLTLFSMFWHFLDIIWIFIFTMVYLMGAK